MASRARDRHLRTPLSLALNLSLPRSRKKAKNEPSKNKKNRIFPENKKNASVIPVGIATR